jgi:short-subunit dehydrogenase
LGSCASYSYFLPYLKTSPRTHLVNIYSLFDLLFFPLQKAYNASKYKVKGFIKALKMERAGSNLALHLGGIKTNIINNALVSTHAILKSQIIANLNKQVKTKA